MDPETPLFPDSRGLRCNKDAVTATVRLGAGLLGVREPADGPERISSHSLRVTGAQGLARLGLDIWAIQLIGRWGSSAVLGYIREAQLDAAAGWAADAVRGSGAPSPQQAMDLDSLVDLFVRKLPQRLLHPVPPADALRPLLLQEADEQVQDQLAAEVQSACARSDPSTSQDGVPPSAYTIVANLDSGMQHRLLLSPPRFEVNH